MSSPFPYRPHWQKQIPFLSLLLVFILGIICQKTLFPGFGETGLLLSCIFCFCAGLIFHFLPAGGNMMHFWRSASLYLAFFFLAAAMHYQQDIRHHLDWYGHRLKETTALRIKVTGPPETKAKTLLLPAEVRSALRKGKWMPARGKIKLYLYKGRKSPEVYQGSTIIIPNKLQAIKGNGNPYCFDYAAYLRKHNIYHQEFLDPKEALILPGSRPGKNFIQDIRTQLLASIHKNVPDKVTQSLIEATLLNDRATLRQDLWRAYSITGIAHIIAISGMHVSILFGILLFLLSWLKNRRWEWIKYFLAIPLVWLYIVLTGFPPSAVRAAVMFTLLAVGIKLSRPRNSINILAATGLLLLFYNPEWLYDTGVQLSFAAVLSILIFYGPIRKSWTVPGRILNYLWNIIAVSLAAQVLVFPLVIYYFHQFPLWVLLANIPAAVFSLLLMCGSLLLFSLDAINIPCLWLGKILVFMTKGFHFFIFLLARHTPALLRHFYIDPLDFWIIMIVVIAGSIFFLQRKKDFLFIALIALCTLFLSFFIQDYVAARQQKIVVYNITGHSVLDRISGKAYHCFHSGNLSAQTIRYNLFPARLGYRVIERNEGRESWDTWRIRQRKILFLNQNRELSRISGSFPVDFLILSNRCAYAPLFWEEVFQPHLIILDSSFPRWEARKWEKKLALAGIPVYNVQEKGAWVFPQGRKETQ
jgi:competence protein ComEC